MTEHVPTQRQDAHGFTVAGDCTSVAEAPRRLPVTCRADVLVVGGGPAGVGAALAAARTGARTVLLERHALLGGMWTAGLVNPVFDFRRKGWLVAELIDRLEGEGAWRPGVSRSTFDVEVMRRLLEEMMEQAGVDYVYHTVAVDTIVTDGRVRGVVVESKAGRAAVLASAVVDCTGDGDVAARAGVPYELGRISDGLMQPMTLMFEVEGIGDYDQQAPGRPSTYDLMLDAIRDHGLDVELPFGRVNYAPAIISLPRPGTAVVQATHVYRLNALEPRQFTQGVAQARRQARDLIRVIRRLPGLENVRLMRTAPTLGVRETRRICGRYRLDLDDLAAGRRFEDAVTFCAFNVDVHEPAPGSGVDSHHNAPMKAYEIPYRCLLPQNVEGLLVAGRCISGSHEAHASYRVTGTCMAMGQAAGLAAAMAAEGAVPPSELPGPAVRAGLAERGAGFLGD